MKTHSDVEFEVRLPDKIQDIQMKNEKKKIVYVCLMQYSDILVVKEFSITYQIQI